jgi:hypothetical protein
MNVNAYAPGTVDSDTTTDRVRCLDCGCVYAKPLGRGTAISNPVCPRCGYLGWVDESLPVTPALLRNRSVADPRLRRRR